MQSCVPALTIRSASTLAGGHEECYGTRGCSGTQYIRGERAVASASQIHFFAAGTYPVWNLISLSS